MTIEKQYSPQAMGIALFEVVHRILDILVDRQIMTADEANDLFAKAGAAQSLLDKPGNQEAGALLAYIAKERSRKFR